MRDKTIVVELANGSIPFLDWLVENAGMTLTHARYRHSMLTSAYDHESLGRVVVIMDADGAVRFRMNRATRRARMKLDTAQNIMWLECVQDSTPNRIDYVSLSTREGVPTLSQRYSQWKRERKGG